MIHIEVITADLAFRDRAGSRLNERDFYETYGQVLVLSPALTSACAAISVAVGRLGNDMREPHVGLRAGTA
jgi:hypothetical protein